MTNDSPQPPAPRPRYPLKTRAWQRTRARIIASQDVCHLCGQPVDKTLSGRHPLGPTVDHRQPRRRGGPLLDESNLALAHLRCNSAKRDRVAVQRTTSRRW